MVNKKNWRSEDILLFCLSKHSTKKQIKKKTEIYWTKWKIKHLCSWKWKTFPGIFPFFSFLWYFSYLLFGHFLLLVIKNENKKKLKNFCLVGNSANETLFFFFFWILKNKLYRTQCPSHTPPNSFIIEWKAKRGKKVLIIYFFILFSYLRKLSYFDVSCSASKK